MQAVSLLFKRNIRCCKKKVKKKSKTKVFVSGKKNSKCCNVVSITVRSMAGIK